MAMAKVCTCDLWLMEAFGNLNWQWHLDIIVLRCSQHLQMAFHNFSSESGICNDIVVINRRLEMFTWFFVRQPGLIPSFI